MQGLAVYLSLAAKRGGWLKFNHEGRCKVYGGILAVLLSSKDTKMQDKLRANDLEELTVDQEAQLQAQLKAARRAVWASSEGDLERTPPTRSKAKELLDEYVPLLGPTSSLSIVPRVRLLGLQGYTYLLCPTDQTVDTVFTYVPPTHTAQAADRAGRPQRQPAVPAAARAAADGGGLWKACRAAGRRPADRPHPATGSLQCMVRRPLKSAVRRTCLN